MFLGSDPHERLTNMAQYARANEAQFLEHLILRAEAVWNFQPPRVPPFLLGGSCRAGSLSRRCPPSWLTCAMLLDQSAIRINNLMNSLIGSGSAGSAKVLWLEAVSMIPALSLTTSRSGSLASAIWLASWCRSCRSCSRLSRSSIRDLKFPALAPAVFNTSLMFLAMTSFLRSLTPDFWFCCASKNGSLSLATSSTTLSSVSSVRKWFVSLSVMRSSTRSKAR